MLYGPDRKVSHEYSSAISESENYRPGKSDKIILTYRTKHLLCVYLMSKEKNEYIKRRFTGKTHKWLKKRYQEMI